MIKEVIVVFSPEAEEVYEYLTKKAQNSKRERIILNAIHNKRKFIISNPHYGKPIAKNLIPEEYMLKYGITNLFRVELPQFWRMFYTLTDGEDKTEMVAFVLDILDHKQYNKKFGYKK